MSERIHGRRKTSLIKLQFKCCALCDWTLTINSVVNLLVSENDAIINPVNYLCSIISFSNVWVNYFYPLYQQGIPRCVVWLRHTDPICCPKRFSRGINLDCYMCAVNTFHYKLGSKDIDSRQIRRYLKCRWTLQVNLSHLNCANCIGYLSYINPVALEKKISIC